MTPAARPAIVTGRQTEPALILCAVRGSLRSALSVRDVEELRRARGLDADHTTIGRWVQRDGLEREERRRRHLQPPTKSWRVDETDGRVKGRWCDLSRALDSPGATIDVVLSGVRDAAAAPRLCRKALTVPSQPQPRVITTDHARLCGAAISGVNTEGLLRPRCRPRPIPYVNHILEPDHRALKRRVTVTRGFREFSAARRTIQGDEARYLIRQGQARRVTGAAGRQQIQVIHTRVDVAA